MPGANLRNYNDSWYISGNKRPVSVDAVNPIANYFYNKSIYVDNKYVVHMAGDLISRAMNWIQSSNWVANIHKIESVSQEYEIMDNIIRSLNIDAGENNSQVYDFSTVIRKIDFPHTNLETFNDIYTNPLSLHKEDLPLKLTTGGTISITFEENQEYYITPLLEKLVRSYATYNRGDNSGRIASSRYAHYYNNRPMYEDNKANSVSVMGRYRSNQIVPGIDVIVSNIIQPRSTSSITTRSNTPSEITADNGFGELVPLYAFTDMKPVSVSSGSFDHGSTTIKTVVLTLKGNIITDVIERYEDYIESIRKGSTDKKSDGNVYAITGGTMEQAMRDILAGGKAPRRPL